MKTEPNGLIAPSMNNGDQLIVACGGLTKREYFAALAMQGILSHPKTNPLMDNVNVIAVNQADRLISQLNRETE